jgi:hypothetical protein
MATRGRQDARALAEKARRLYPWFPPGEITDFEKPDLLLIDGDDRIGIEVTELFQSPKHGSKFGPHVVKKFHQRVMQIAERRAQSFPPLDVVVYFEYRDHLNDQQSTAAALVNFVHAHPSGTYTKLDGIPHGIPKAMCSASGLWPNRRDADHSPMAAADGHMNAASGRDIQTRPEAPREADRERERSAAGLIPRAVWTPRA